MRIYKKLSLILCVTMLLTSLFALSANAQGIIYGTGEIYYYCDDNGVEGYNDNVAFIPQKYPDELYEKIYLGIKNYSDRVDVSEFDLSVADITWVYTSVFNNNPDLFYLEPTFGYSYYSDNTVAFFAPMYKYDESQLPVVVADYESRITNIVSHFDTLSNVEAVVAVNDYLATHYQYDSYGLETDPQNAIHDAYSMLIEKRGVCQAYALLFTEIMRRLGVETVSVVSNSMNHQWNLVKLNENWYHIDVTWDDPVGALDGYTYHNYMLHSDNAMLERLGHYDWIRIDNRTEQCTDTTYDDWAWTEANTQLTPHNNKWYYVSNEGDTINVVEISDEGKKIVYSQQEHWDVWGEPGYSYTSGLATATWWKNWMLYHSQDKLYCYDTALGKAYFLSDLNPTDGYVYYIHADDGVLDFVVSKDPSNFTNADHYTLDINCIQYIGDVNGDDTVSSSDALALMYNLLGYSSNDGLVNADVNGDGCIDSADLLWLNQVLIGVKDTYVIYNS